MKNNNETRRVLVLIPPLIDYKNDPQMMESLNKIKKEINLIVKQVSDAISKLIQIEYSQLNEMTKRIGVPNISLEVIDSKYDNKKSGIRLCLTRYNELDFSRNYCLKVSEYKENDISHVLELELHDEVEKSTWSATARKDAGNSNLFDAKVICNIDDLYKIVLSFMIDIYVYYIIGLYKDYDFRFIFSTYKVEYLNDNFSPDVKKTFGFHHLCKTVPKGISYLPISLQYLFAKNPSPLISTVKSYYEIIFQYVIRENRVYFTNGAAKVESLINYNKSKIINEAIQDCKTKFPEETINSFDYLAIYNPCLEQLNIENDQRRKKDLFDEIYTSFIQQYTPKSKVILYNKEQNFYCLIHEDNVDDIFPFFPYFSWFTINPDFEESEEI